MDNRIHSSPAALSGFGLDGIPDSEVDIGSIDIARILIPPELSVIQVILRWMMTGIPWGSRDFYAKTQ
jgi:hypothetical protein